MSVFCHGKRYSSRLSTPQQQETCFKQTSAATKRVSQFLARPFWAYQPGWIYLATCLRRSAQRRFIASAIAFRPSGLSFRFVALAGLFGATALATTVFALFLLPLGRPRPLFAGAAAAAPPLNNALACTSFNISASICAITSLIAKIVPPSLAATRQ